MRKEILAAAAALFVVLSSIPAMAQDRPVTGAEAVEIVTRGQIRASSSEGFQGFLLLIEYKGKHYTCSVNATGQVQTCYPLYW